MLLPIFSKIFVFTICENYFILYMYFFSSYFIYLDFVFIVLFIYFNACAPTDIIHDIIHTIQFYSLITLKTIRFDPVYLFNLLPTIHYCI